MYGAGGTNGEAKPNFLKQFKKGADSYGFYNVAEAALLVSNKWFWDLVAGSRRLSTFFNRRLINSLIYKMPPRPNRLSTMRIDHPVGTDAYPSWDSLTDRAWSARHLGPVSQEGLPPVEKVVELFRRPKGGPDKLGKSSVLFSYFAQWFTDGFLRTDYNDPRKNTSNHDIDLSNLYGLNRRSTSILRSHEGGKLKSQWLNGEEYPPDFYQDGFEGDEFLQLPMNTLIPGFEREVRRKLDGKALFAMGGDRINSHPGFMAMNVLFLREHNRVCDVLKAKHPAWDDGRLFQTARNIMIALLTKIVIEEYINHITPYQFQLRFQAGEFESQRWYRQNWMAVEFNLLYRWHSLVPDHYTLDGKNVPLRETLFRNDLVVERGLGPFLDDASRQQAGRICLFNTPDELLPVEKASVELGRKVGLASFNEYRALCKFSRARTFEHVSEDPETQRALKDVYGTVDRVEYYPGIFADAPGDLTALSFIVGRIVSVDAFSQALTNPLLSQSLFNKDTFSAEGIEIIEGTKSLSDVVRRNTPAGSGPFYISMTYKKDAPPPRASEWAGTLQTIRA